MAHSRTPGGVQIDDSKTSYLMNPGVGYTLGEVSTVQHSNASHRSSVKGYAPEEEEIESTHSLYHLRLGMNGANQC